MYSCCWVYRSFILSYYGVVSHCINTPGFVHPFTCGWIAELYQSSAITDKTVVNIPVQVTVAKCIYFPQA